MFGTAPTRMSGRKSRSLSFERLESRALLAAVSGSHLLDEFAITGNVGEKPESKIWEQAGRWWGVFSDTTGTHVWRLDGQTWTRTFTISDAKNVQVDAKANGNVTHVLFRNNLNSQLYSLQYEAGPVPTYRLWNNRPAPASIQLAATAEAATIDLDSQGRMWVGYDDQTTIKVRYSDAPYSHWSEPIVLANGVKKDDLAALTALPNGTVGVLWSNHKTGQFGFRTHVDGTDPARWTEDELPGSRSVSSTDNPFTNDHINLAVASDATLYAAIKTGYSAEGLPKLGILVRRPNGVWDDFHPVNVLNASRPIIQLNEAANTLILSYNRGSHWAYHECDATTITCSDAKILLSTGVNGTSTKQTVTSSLVILTSGKSSSGTVSGAVLHFGASNAAPVVNAGRDQTTLVGQAVNLIGVVTDDSRPTPPAAVTTVWSKMSGPGEVTFSNAAALRTTASFSQPGTYVLELSAHDGELSRKDKVTISVNHAPVTGLAKSFQDGVFPTAAYSGTRDTKLRASNPTTNYGQDQQLEVFQRPVFTSLFKWDVSEIPKGATVLGASLTLNGVNRCKNTYEIYELLNNWVESEATFLQASRNVSWNTSGAMGVGKDRGSTLLGTIVSPKKGLVSVDLNAAGIAVIQKWISNPASNHGFVLQDISDPLLRNWVITSSEGLNPLTRPKLTIRFASSSNAAASDATRASTLRNGDNPLDVNADTHVTPQDALIIINAMKPGSAEGEAESDDSSFFLDVSGDGSVGPLDALLVINHLHRNTSLIGESEGERASHGLLITVPEIWSGRDQSVDFTTLPPHSPNRLNDVTAGAPISTVPSTNDAPSTYGRSVDAAVLDHVLAADPELGVESVCHELQNRSAVTPLVAGDSLFDLLEELGSDNDC